MNHLKANRGDGERPGILRGQALVYAAVVGEFNRTGRPVTTECIREMLDYSRPAVAAALVALFKKGLVDRRGGAIPSSPRAYVYYPRRKPPRLRRDKDH